MNRKYPTIWLKKVSLARGWGAIRFLLCALVVVLSLPLLPARPVSAQSDYAWRTLLVVYPAIKLQYTDGNGNQQNIDTTGNPWSNSDYQPYLQAWKNLPGLARYRSNGEATVEQTVEIRSNPLSSVTNYGDNTYWISPNDVAADLATLAPAGTYDSIFILARLYDPSSGLFVPVRGRSTGLAASTQSNNATFASVVDVNTNVDTCMNDLWLGAWLRGVSQFYSNNGFAMPVGGFNSPEAHGYTQDPTTCWQHWITDYMTGSINEPSLSKNVGITPAAWEFGTPTQQGPHQNGIATFASYLLSIGVNDSTVLYTNPNNQSTLNFSFVQDGIMYKLDGRWELFFREASGYYHFFYWDNTLQTWLLFDPGFHGPVSNALSISDYSARMRSCPYVQGSLHFRPPGVKETYGYFRETSAMNGSEEWIYASQPPADYHLWIQNNNPYFISDDKILVCDPLSLAPFAAMTVAPSIATASGLPGQTINYALTLTNTGNISDSYTINVTPNLWPASATPLTTTNMLPGTSTAISVSVTIPSTITSSNVDTTTITITSVTDGTKSAIATLISRTYRIFLPFNARNYNQGW